MVGLRIVGKKSTAYLARMGTVAILSFPVGEGTADQATLWEIRPIIDGLFGPRDYTRAFNSRAEAVAAARSEGAEIIESLSDA
jgi:hypothetical protein